MSVVQKRKSLGMGDTAFGKDYEKSTLTIHKPQFVLIRLLLKTPHFSELIRKSALLRTAFLRTSVFVSSYA